VGIDSREILKVRSWKREYLDRQVWRRHLKEAKVRLRLVASQKKEEGFIAVFTRASH
jgi:ribosomal protein L31E